MAFDSLDSLDSLDAPDDGTSLNPPRKLRGFALLKLRDPERFKAIAQKAGRVSQATQRGHRWNVAEASRAGKKSSTQRAQRVTTSVALAS